MKNLYIIFFIVILPGTIFSQTEINDFRRDVDILHYTINLNITDFKNKTISGNVKILLNPRKKDLTEINLDLLKLEVDSIFLNNKKTDNYIYNGSIIKIPYNSQISTEKNSTELTVFYHGHPIEDLAWGGFFFSDSVAFNIGVGMAAEPQSFGRVWFPCIDSFEEKASVTYNIVVPKGFKAVCSGVLEDVSDSDDGTQVFHWNLPQETPSYLISVAVGKYEIIEDIYKGIMRDIPISLYVNKEDLANTNYSFKNLKNAMASFEKGYGEYMFDRIGYVSVPFTSGAMEHTCNIAYPDYALDSTLYRETLMAHELSHHWFGNLVTCKTAGDMWLNEGWASFSEALFEEDVYGKETYKNYVRENHIKVLTQAHILDNGYRAVYGVPHDYTYGTTVYDKGADVAHTLRGYLGDSLFFSSLTAYLKAFAFKSADTYEFRDFLTEFSGIELTPFFESWVFEKGFPHFSAGNIDIEKVGNEYKAEVRLLQKLVERDYFGTHNKIELTFSDKNLNLHTKTVEFSGPEESIALILPFEPTAVFVDLDEKVSDATVDNYKRFDSAGRHDFLLTDFSLEVKNLKGSLFVQSVLNLIKPEFVENSNYKISEIQYWNIAGVSNGKSTTEGIFYANTDVNNLAGNFEDLILLYRPNSDAALEKVLVKKDAISENEGLIRVKNVKFGEYLLAVEK